MTNTERHLIDNTIAFVKETLKNAEGGHDWLHIERVYHNALMIAKHEDVDMVVIAIGALLHDIADAKFHNGDENIGPKIAKDYLKQQGVDQNTITHIEQIIRNVSYKNALETHSKQFKSNELLVIQDADRLDAIGAIGIARTFNYGGFKNRKLYDPDVPVNDNLTKEAYKNSRSPTINHFHEKLLKLKDMMNTGIGKQLAKERHNFMLQFLDQFYREIESHDD